jgi:glycosyltransferase involved in cell wall biosynthesis
MTHQPRVTILTPTYNRATLLEITIESVLAQTYPNIEYIVLDDGSTDDTLDVLNRYQDRLTWLTHPNMGEARTVNRGFERAAGDLIGVVNSDDPVMPDLVERVVEAAHANPDALVFYPDWFKIDADGTPISPVFQREYDFRHMLTDGVCLVGPGAFFRRQALQYGGRDIRYRSVGDFAFWLRLGAHARFVRVPYTLATHRVHADSATVAGRGKAAADEMIEMMHDVFAQSELPPQYRALERTSSANMEYLAGAQCLPDDIGSARRLFRRSFRRDPSRMLRQPRRLAQVIASHMLPPARYSALYRRWMARKAEYERAAAKFTHLDDTNAQC